MWGWYLSAPLMLDLSRWFALINRMWAEAQLPLLTRSTKTNQIVSSLRLSLCLVVVQTLSHVWLFVTPWTAACQVPLSFHYFKLVSIESVTLFNHVILYCPLLLCLQSMPASRSFLFLFFFFLSLFIFFDII